MEVFIEYNISGHTLLLLIQEYQPNEIIICTLLLIPKEYGHKFWSCIVTLIDYHKIKVAQYPCYTQLICLIDIN